MAGGPVSATMLVRYGRAGGRAPSDDESLEVATDGSWTARRTVSGRRVGRFAGSLSAEPLAALAAIAAAAAGSGDASVPTPRHGATESVEVEGGSATLGSNEEAPGAWGPLVEWLRAFVRDEAVANPVAGLELEADLGSARLLPLGSEPPEVEPGSIEVRVVRVTPDGIGAGEWSATADAGGPAPIDLPFSHGLTAASGDVLQVRVVARVRDDGLRTVRLYAPVRA
jgi:hypothetical protein